MSNINPLGSLARLNARKDAVHIAILPTIAGEVLAPSQAVKLNEMNHAVAADDYGLGIVDPFLNAVVGKNERFYILLYPNTITSLRHEWVHPQCLGDTYEIPTKEEAKIWLESYATSPEIDLTFETLIEAANDFIDYFDYLIDGDKWDGVTLHENFWDYYEIFTGKSVPTDRRGSFFSCSC